MYGYGYSPFVNNATVATVTPPVNTVKPAIKGTAQEGQTLTCSPGTWTGTPEIKYYFEWKRNDIIIEEANTDSYLLGSFDVGQLIKCTVIAANNVGKTSADSNTVRPKGTENIRT